MSKLLFIQASPRDEKSFSIRAGWEFACAYKETHPDADVREMSLFETDLPPFDAQAAKGKYAVLAGNEVPDEAARKWGKVLDLIEEFKSYDVYLFAVPMWNFSIPYVLKHYIDCLVQPGQTFSFDPETGYSGLVKGKKAVVIYARSGEYTGDRATMDYQTPYMKMILGFIGIEDVEEIVIEPTLMQGPKVAKERLEEAKKKAAELAGKI